MDRTKKMLNIAVSISIILCSVSIFILAVKGSTANAQTLTDNSYQPVGVVNGGVGVYDVIGYNTKTGGTKILAKGKY